MRQEKTMLKAKGSSQETVGSGRGTAGRKMRMIRALTPVYCLLFTVSFIFALSLLLGGCKKSPPTPAAPPAPAKAGVPKGAEAKAPPVAEKAKEVFVYSPGGRRDPFKPLVVAKAPGEKIKGDPKKALEVGDLKLVGIVWDKQGYYALVETPQGLGYTLRKNDQVGVNAVVQNITKDAVHFQVKTRAYAGAKGETSEVVLKLRKED